MILTSPWGLALLGLAVPVLVLHVLRPHRVARPVSSTLLWRELASPVSAARPWQRLRPNLLLLVQLLAVIALAVAVARPARVTPAPLAEHTVFIVDASGSMAARDGEPDRLASATRRAHELYRELPAGGMASVVVASDRPRVALSTSRDPQAFTDALDGIRTGAGGADFAEAFALAVSLEAPGVPIGFVLLSDGGLDDEAVRLLPPGTNHEVVGRDAANRALHRLSIEPRGSGLHARLTVVNGGDSPVTHTIRFEVDGRPSERREVTVEPRGTFAGDVDLPAATRVTAELDGEDLLPADDRVFGVSGARRNVRVLVAGPGDPFLDAVLGIIPGATVERVPDGQPANGFDLAIYDRVPVPASPGAPFLAIAPPGGAPDVAVEGAVAQPAATLVRTDDPLLSDLDLSRLAIAGAQRVRAPKAETLVGAEGSPLLVRGTVANRPYLYLAFELAQSNLPTIPALPLLLDRMVTELSSSAPPPTDLVVGRALPITPGVAATVVDPEGRELAVVPGAAPPVAGQPGFWTIRIEGRPDLVVPVNAEPDESRLAPVGDLPVPAANPRPGEEPPAGEAPLLAWVLAAALVLVLVEVALSWRRLGVGRRQWRVALGVRAVIAFLLLGALAGAAVVRPADRVATVFVIDGSDSMAAGARTEAVAWVRDALDHQPDDAVSGVVLFARDARVELTVRERQILGQPAVRVDGSRTNLVNALRLSAALLPADARRRVVVVSDGRITEGDTAAEAARLADQGIRVDVHTTATVSRDDVAVVDVDGPNRARPGERVELQVRLVSTFAGPAVVTLDRDGRPVDERPVDLRVGSNAVTFSVVVPRDRLDQGTVDGGIDRYRVRVTAPTDAEPQNNVGFVPVQIERPPRLLVAEGRAGAARELAAALHAANLPLDVIDADRLPGVEGLAGYSSVVLVDVDQRDLSAEQVAALASSTRDQGHGLVTVGGPQSYGMGGYRNSPLEDLLPVMSELQDPERKQRVAQVLAIDTSGSMGSPGTAAGGVAKSEIARAGAARAIEALDSGDEVGLLSVSDTDRWVMELQRRPSDGAVRAALDQMGPNGGTNLSSSLLTAAEALRRSTAPVRHIILLSDGLTGGDVLALMTGQARELAEEGITVSVLATGEDSAGQFELVAEAGRGRFHPGNDLHDIPQIMQDEVIRVSRGFITEGEFVPEVTSGDEVVADLRRAPPLLGYVATTSKPTATTQLRIGPERDPLLATWQVGLGQATSWTSDATARWSAHWLGWDGYVDFWSRLVKATLPQASTGGAVRAQISGDTLTVRAEAESPFPDGATARARITGPGGEGVDVPMVRLDATTFAGEVAVSRPGSYAVGAQVAGGDGRTVLAASTLVSQAYSAEYRPMATDPGVLASLATVTEGRVEPARDSLFTPDGLVPGRSRLPLAGWFLLAAALLWPLALALSRLTLRRPAALALPRRRPERQRRRAVPRPAPAPVEADEMPEPPPPPEPEAEPAEPVTTLDHLLTVKRHRATRD